MCAFKFLPYAPDRNVAKPTDASHSGFHSRSRFLGILELIKILMVTISMQIKSTKWEKIEKLREEIANEKMTNIEKLRILWLCLFNANMSEIWRLVWGRNQLWVIKVLCSKLEINYEIFDELTNMFAESINVYLLISFLLIATEGKPKIRSIWWRPALHLKCFLLFICKFYNYRQCCRNLIFTGNRKELKTLWTFLQRPQRSFLLEPFFAPKYREAFCLQSLINI